MGPDGISAYVLAIVGNLKSHTRRQDRFPGHILGIWQSLAISACQALPVAYKATLIPGFLTSSIYVALKWTFFSPSEAWRTPRLCVVSSLVLLSAMQCFGELYVRFCWLLCHIIAHPTDRQTAAPAFSANLKMIRCWCDKWCMSFNGQMENLTVSPCHSGRIVKIIHGSIKMVRHWKWFSLLPDFIGLTISHGLSKV